MCTIPINSVLDLGWNSASMAMEARILRTLYWFGRLDHRREPIDGQRFGERHFYRRTVLFDRFLFFGVRTSVRATIRRLRSSSRPRELFVLLLSSPPGFALLWSIICSNGII